MGLSSSLHSVPVCTPSHSCTPISFETHKGAVTSHLFYPQPSTIPAEGSLYTRLPGHLTALHPHSQASPSTCTGSRSKKRGDTEPVPLCRSWHSLLLQSTRTHSQEVIGDRMFTYAPRAMQSLNWLLWFNCPDLFAQVLPPATCPTCTLFMGSPWHVVVLLFTIFQWVLVTEHINLLYYL